jgi:hypothetical protein
VRRVITGNGICFSLWPWPLGVRFFRNIFAFTCGRLRFDFCLAWYFARELFRICGVCFPKHALVHALQESPCRLRVGSYAAFERVLARLRASSMCTRPWGFIKHLLCAPARRGRLCLALALMS